MRSATGWRGGLGVSFLWGFIVNLAWELAQRALYLSGKAARPGEHLIHCLFAALADAVAIAALYGMGILLFRTSDWGCRPGVRGWLLTLGLGSVGAIVAERVALAFGWWRYGSGMPIVPGLGVGLTPLLQFLLLPPVIMFFGTCRWLRKPHRESRDTASQRGARPPV